MKIMIFTAYLLVALSLPIREGYAQKDVRIQNNASATSQPVSSVKSMEPLLLSVGKSTILPIEGTLTRVSVANPEIIDVTIIRSR